MNDTLTNHLDFGAILLRARQLTIRFNSIHRKLLNDVHDYYALFDEFDEPDFNEQRETLAGICIAMGLLAETPNAYINFEALAAFEKVVERASIELDAQWVKELVDGTPSEDSR